MREYSKGPKNAAFVFEISGRSPVDDAPIALRVTASGGILYTTWLMDGKTVYRRQYSGRNVAKLHESIDELIAGAVEPMLKGSRDFFPKSFYQEA
jgi:hypothetical protein